MNLKSASQSVLDQLLNVIDQMDPDDYMKTIDVLGASVGQHVRHILEFYQRLLKGERTGIVNYDLRERDLRIETDKNFSMRVINQLIDQIKLSNSPDALKLEIKYGVESDESIVLETNFNRELAYNIEHAIHHMAIIKGALREQYKYVNLPQDFGVASSTVRYHKGQ